MPDEPTTAQSSVLCRGTLTHTHDPTSVPILDELAAEGADARDLTPEQVRSVRALLEDPERGGLWLFGFYICGLTKLTPALHWEMCWFLSQWGKPGWRRLLMRVPRGSYKTSCGSKALPLWLATRNPELTIGMFNAAEHQAKSWIGSIREIMERSHLYHMLWPERLPPGLHFRDVEAGRTLPKKWKWGDTGLRFPRNDLAVSELTIEPFGIGGASTGKHYDFRIMDDLIGEVAATSPALIEDSIHFMDYARSLEKPSHGGCELINCTPWAYRDCYSHVLERWPDDYKVYHRSLLEHPVTGEPDVVNGESIFPESITTDKAKQMLADDLASGSIAFWSQYQCIPKAGKDTSFQPEWVRAFHIELARNGEPSIRIPPPHFDPVRVDGAVAGERAPDLVPLAWCDRAVLLDPAPSKRGERSQEPRARNGIVVVALDPWGRKFVLQDAPLREDPLTVMEAIVLLAVYWKVRKVGIEEVNFSAVYAPLWNALLRHRHPQLQLSFLPLLPKGEDKDTRIRALQAPMREGHWYFNLDRTRYTVQELLEYPHADTRDLIDALAYWKQALGRPQTPTELEVGHYNRKRWDAQRDIHTGYAHDPPPCPILRML